MFMNLGIPLNPSNKSPFYIIYDLCLLPYDIQSITISFGPCLPLIDG